MDGEDNMNYFDVVELNFPEKLYLKLHEASVVFDLINEVGVLNLLLVNYFDLFQEQNKASGRCIKDFDPKAKSDEGPVISFSFKLDDSYEDMQDTFLELVDGLDHHHMECVLIEMVKAFFLNDVCEQEKILFIQIYEAIHRFLDAGQNNLYIVSDPDMYNPIKVKGIVCKKDVGLFVEGIYKGKEISVPLNQAHMVGISNS